MSFRLKQRLRYLKYKWQRYLSRKFSTRLIITYVGLGALPLLIISIILITLTQNTVQTYIYERNMETARRASKEIYLFIKEPLTILQTTALSRDVVEMDQFAQSNIINKIKDENPIFQKIFVVNDSGIVTVTTKFGEESKNYHDQPFFKAGMQGNEFFSDVYFTPSRFPVLTIAEPIIKYNQVVGVLAAEIDLKNIWDLVDTITIGNTGNAFLLSARGRVIAHQEKEKVLERTDYSQYEFFEEMQDNNQGITTLMVDDQESIIAYVQVPQLNWGVVIQQSQQEAFTLADQMQKRVLLFVALTTVVAILLGLLSVQRFTKPLLQLVKGAKEYERGNLKHRIKMKRRDELAELAQEFNSMANSLLKNQKELQRMERLEALSRFASLVSHEIRNPLNAMNINMQMLKRVLNRPDISANRKLKYLNVMASEIDRMNDMVSNFLAITRPPKLNLTPIDIHRVLDEVILMQEARARSEGAVIKRKYVHQKIVGLFDYNQLKQVFHNIIVNALEAMKDGGTLSIRTTVIEKDAEKNNKCKFVKIEFKDTGAGIPPEILKEVFEFYYTTKRAGTGLGLAIAKQIVEGHNGIVYIDSKEGNGTYIYIELPIDEAIKKG